MGEMVVVAGGLVAGVVGVGAAEAPAVGDVVEEAVGAIATSRIPSFLAVLKRFVRDLGNIEAVQHGYRLGGLTGAGDSAAQRDARRVIAREGNRRINRFVRAVGFGPRSR